MTFGLIYLGVFVILIWAFLLTSNLGACYRYKFWPVSAPELIQSEVNKGFISGPYEKLPFSVYRVNPLGIAESKYSGKKRLIVDLSAPHNDVNHASLNDLIQKEEFSLNNVTIDHAVALIKKTWHRKLAL